MGKRPHSNGRGRGDAPDGAGSGRRRSPRNVLDILEALRAKRIAPRSLSPTERRACVETLSDEGLSVDEIARLLDYSPRQISRIRAAIRRDRALRFDPNRTAEIAGDFIARMEVVIQRSRRAARAPGATSRDQIMAERNVREALKDLITGLQSLGFANRVFARSAKPYEAKRDVVAKFLYEQVRTEAMRTADFARRFDAMKQELLNEGIDIDALMEDFEDGDDEAGGVAT